MTRRELLGAARAARRRARRSARASPRAASSRSLAASLRAVRFRRASRMSHGRRVSSSRSSTAASDSKSYIIEVVGCGVAFLDYDNDGWLDLFVLSGTRLEGAPPGATNRLYKNNRDGTFTDVTAEGRPDSHRLGLGGDRRRLRQRRLRRSVHHLLRPQRALSQQRRRHVHRCHREGGPSPGRGPLRRPAAPGWTTIATATSICSSRTT